MKTAQEILESKLPKSRDVFPYCEVLEAMESYAAQQVAEVTKDVTRQRDELLTALKQLVHLHGCEQEGLLSGQPTPEQWYKAVEQAEAAIKSTER